MRFQNIFAHNKLSPNLTDSEHNLFSKYVQVNVRSQIYRFANTNTNTCGYHKLYINRSRDFR